MRYLILFLLFFSSHSFAGPANFSTCSQVCSNQYNNCGSFYGTDNFFPPGSNNNQIGYRCPSSQPCPSGQSPTGGQCYCSDGSQPDAFDRCPEPACPQGEYNNPNNGNCIPEPCEGGGFACCDSTTPPDACENPPPCNELTDPECAPGPDPDCGENQFWDGTTCVNLTSSQPSSSEGGSSSEPDTGGDSSDPDSSGGDSSEPDNSGGSNSSEGNSGEQGGSNSSQGQQGTASGGENCDSPPVCEGDEIQCSILEQQWLQRCPTTAGEFEGEPTEGLEGFYEPEYPNGFSDIWSKRQPDLMSTPIYVYIDSWKLDISGGEAPPMQFCFDMGFVNFGCHTVELDPRMFPFLRIFFIVLALILARSLVLGG